MVVVGGDLDEPVDDGEEGGPAVGGPGGFQGGLVELDGAVELLEDDVEVVLELREREF